MPALPENRKPIGGCGNMPMFNPIGLDQVLTVPTMTATGRFLVYEARNRERETICRLRVDVVSKGSESDPDKEAVIGFVAVIASSSPIAVGTPLD